MKHNRFLTVALIIATWLVPALSACTPSAPATIQEIERVITATPEPEATPETVTITYWHLPDVMDADLAAIQVAEFEASHPYIKVEVVPISTDTAEEGILAALAAGVPPDVCQMNATEVAKYAQWGALVALDEFSNWDEISDRIPAGAIQSYSGHVYAMPWRTNPVMLFYNKDLYGDAGLDPEDPPETWAELLVQAEALTRDTNGDGQMDTYGFVAYPDIHKWYRPYFLWTPLYYTATGGMGVIADDGSAAVVNNAGALQTLEFLQTLYTNYSSMDITSYTDAFYQGQGAMLVSGTFMVPRIRSNAPDMDFGMAPIPVPEGGPVDHAITHSDERDLVIFSLSDKQHAAWEFVEFISSPDQAVNLMETTGMYMVLKDMTGYPAISEYLSQDPFLLAGAEEMNYIRLPVAHPSHQEIYAALAYELSAALVVGSETPAEALAAAEASINAILGAE